MAQTPLTPGETAEFVGFKMPQADAEELTEQARRAGMSKSAFIRIAVLVALATRRQGPPGEGGQPPDN